MHSINLWVQLLGDSQNSEVLEPLLYPLVQLINGTIRLNYTAKYFPLRFHLCKLLNQLSDQSGKFIPVLPYFLDILNTHNFGKKVPKLSMKPMDFSCVLRLSKSQMSENAFKESTIEHVYTGLLETLSVNSHKICFPEFCVPALAQLRSFLKKCKIANYTKKMKSVKEKIEESGTFMQNKRSKVSFGVKDLGQIAVFEAQIKAQETPLTKFFETYKGIKESEKAKKLKKEMDDYKHIPEVKSKKSDKKPAEEFQGIFGNSEDESDDEMDDNERFELREERGKKSKKNKRRNEDTESESDDEEPESKKAKQIEASESEDDMEDQDDIVEDFDNFSDE